MPTHISNIRVHAAFLVIASLLATQGCGEPVSASPAATNPVAATSSGRPGERVVANSQIDAGRYLVKLGGCNDCHTPGFVETNGAAPAEADWLTGATVGFSGPWGVSYAANLRLSFQNMTEAEFLELAHEGKGRPPMPWPSLMAMSDSDLRAIYAYVHYLGPKGEPAPAALSPGVTPDRPYVAMMPQMPPIAPSKRSR